MITPSIKMRESICRKNYMSSFIIIEKITLISFEIFLNNAYPLFFLTNTHHSYLMEKLHSLHCISLNYAPPRSFLFSIFKGNFEWLRDFKMIVRW